MALQPPPVHMTLAVPLASSSMLDYHPAELSVSKSFRLPLRAIPLVSAVALVIETLQPTSLLAMSKLATSPLLFFYLSEASLLVSACMVPLTGIYTQAEVTPLRVHTGVGSTGRSGCCIRRATQPQPRKRQGGASRGRSKREAGDQPTTTTRPRRDEPGQRQKGEAKDRAPTHGGGAESDGTQKRHKDATAETKTTTQGDQQDRARTKT